jgi:hypothetical protein
VSALEFANIKSPTEREGDKENNRKKVKLIKPDIPVNIGTTTNVPGSSL